ncbi:MAG TPA: hypothetical protein VIM17_11055 [Jatrophihabitantaceae bacterium]|jgi:hypothetical protein
MSYEALWVVTFVDQSDSERIRAAGPFPALEPAQSFARELRETWPEDRPVEIDVTQLESTDPISDLVAGDR